MPEVEVRQTERGLFHVHFRADCDELAFRRYLATLDQVLAAREPYAVIFTDGIALRMPPELRRLQADWIRARAPEITRYCAATAFVLENAVSRFVLSSILLLVPMPCPFRSFADTDAANAWARALVGEAWRPRAMP